MERLAEKIKAFVNNRWLVFVCAMWVQSCAGVGYLFGSISPVIKSAMGYNQRQIAILGVAKDLGDSIGFVAGSLCEILPIWVILLIGVIQNFVGYGLLGLVVANILPDLPLWVLCVAIFVGTNGETYYNLSLRTKTLPRFFFTRFNLIFPFIYNGRKKLKPRKLKRKKGGKKGKRMLVLKSRSLKSRPISELLMKVGSIRRYVSCCRAVLLPRFGGPEVLELRPDVPVPDLKPNEVLVRARAVSINPLDTRMRSGYGRSIFEPLLPLILGRDVSGEVAAVGASVKSLNVGQEVFGALHPTAVRGTYADYAILSEDELSPKPDSVTHVEASAIPFAALTAWRALKSTARITEGQRLLVIGGGGAVGFAAIQIAVAAGCHVTTTCGNRSINRVIAAGAEQAVDYTSEDIELVIKGKFDAVLDTIGVPETERIGINLLNKGGHYMTLQGEAAALSDRYGLPIGLPVATALLLKKRIQYRYSHGTEYSWIYMRADSEGLHEIRRLSEAGKLNIPVEKTFSITQVREAHEAKDKKQILGKVVLELD